jgi:hypothetical protein
MQLHRYIPQATNRVDCTAFVADSSTDEPWNNDEARPEFSNRKNECGRTVVCEINLGLDTCGRVTVRVSDPNPVLLAAVPRSPSDWCPFSFALQEELQRHPRQNAIQGRDLCVLHEFDSGSFRYLGAGAVPTVSWRQTEIRSCKLDPAFPY